MTRRPAAERKGFPEFDVNVPMPEGTAVPPSGRIAESAPARSDHLAIVYRPLTSLVPYTRNARTHSPEQIVKLRASLRRFGWTNPILVAGNDVIAGHARLTTARQMAEEGDTIARNADPWSAPTIDLSDLSEEERKAYILADNRIALDAGWDQDLLRVELSELMTVGFDVELTGFTLKEVGDFTLSIGGPGEKEEKRYTEEENRLLDVAWQRAMVEWFDIVRSYKERAWLTTGYTKGVLGVQYLRALFGGDEIPRGATLAYTPHRIFCEAGSQAAISSLFEAAWKPEARSLRDSVRWNTQQKPSLDYLLGASSLPIHQFRLANDFPAQLARDLIDEFSTNMESAILDPCHGWGGRMLGFLLSERASYYHGFDPSLETSLGVTAMYKDLAALTPGREKIARLECLPFEDAVLEEEGYDFALTSPPYYDTEKYQGELTSWRRYSSFPAWLDGFYYPMIQKTAAALAPRGIFALQVGSQAYPLADKAIEFAPLVRMKHIETRHTRMVNNQKGTDPDQGEVVLILRKE